MKRHQLGLLLLIVWAVCLQSGPAWATVVGAFDYWRAGAGNLTTGLFTYQARTALLTNFPGLSFATTSTLTPEYLAGIDLMIIPSSATTNNGIPPLTADEQTALYDFVRNGGRAMLMADAYTSVASAQSLLTPFGVTVADDGLSGLLYATKNVPDHPIFSGPFGVQEQVAVLGAGVFTSLGPYATRLATMNATGLPVIASLEFDALGPGSGRVLFFSDATLFADPGADGFFSESRTLFLNSIDYLLVIPEPSSLALAGVGFTAALFWAARRRGTQSTVIEQ